MEFTENRSKVIFYPILTVSKIFEEIFKNVLYVCLLIVCTLVM